MKIRSSHASVTKVLTGIRGFDEITGGGLPRGRTTLVTGGPGSGKSVFALQTLVNGADRLKEAGLFVAFEESTGQIVANAATFGWDIPTLAENKLFFLDARLSPDVVKAGEFDLVGMLAVLEAKAKELQAKRVVFDGIDVLLALLDDPVAERREIYRIRDWLSRTGLTGIITQKAGLAEGDRCHNFLQFMVDCVVVLRHQVVEGSAFRNLRVMKYRGSGFSGDQFPIALTTDGLQLTNRDPRSSSAKSPMNACRRGCLVSTTCCVGATIAAATFSSLARPGQPSRRSLVCSSPRPARAVNALCT